MWCQSSLCTENLAHPPHFYALEILYLLKAPSGLETMEYLCWDLCILGKVLHKARLCDDFALGQLENIRLFQPLDDWGKQRPCNAINILFIIYNLHVSTCDAMYQSQEFQASKAAIITNCFIRFKVLVWRLQFFVHTNRWLLVAHEGQTESLSLFIFCYMLMRARYLFAQSNLKKNCGFIRNDIGSIVTKIWHTI